MVTKEHGDIDVRLCMPPPITRASRQIRTESLPFFFSVNMFKAEIKATYTTHSNPLFRGSFIPQNDPRFKRAGTLRLRREILNMFSGVGSQAVRVKNLHVILVDYYGRADGEPYYLNADIVLQTQAASHTAEITHSADGKGFAYEQQNLDHIIIGPKSFLEATTGRPGYNGLTLRDMMRLANTLRVTPRDGAEVLEVETAVV